MPQAISAAAVWIGNTIATGVGVSLTAAGLASASALPIALTVNALAITSAEIAIYAGIQYGIDQLARGDIPRQQGGELQLSIDPEYPREMIVGTRAVAGSLVARYSRGSNLSNALIVVQVADHWCTELSKVYGDGALLRDTPLTHGVRTAIPAYNNPYEGDRLWLTWYDGRPGQTADAYLIAASEEDPFVVAGEIDAWTTDHVGAGCAYVIVEAVWDPDILTQIPSLLFLAKGARIYDRRQDTTAGGSGAHRLDDPSTWEYSENAMDVIDHFALGYQVEEDPLAFGLGLLAAEIPYAGYEHAADLSDEDVETGTGDDVETIKRYAANGVISTAQYFEDVIESLQLQMAARVVDLGGRIGILGAEERTSVCDLSDDDWVSDEAVQFSDKLAFNDLIGAVTGSFADPGNLYQPTPYDKQSTAYAALPDGGEAQTVQVDLPFETHPRRAARLISAWLARESLQPRLAGTFMATAWALEAGDWFTFSSTRLQITDELFEVIDIVKNADFTVTLTARAIDPDFLAFDNDNDPDLSVPPEVSPISLILDEPEFDVEVSTLVAGGVVEPCLQITLTTDETVAREIVIEYAKWDGAPDIVGPSLVDSFHVSQIVTKLRKGILPSTQYAVRAKSKAGPRESPWTAWSTPVTTGATYSVGSAATATLANAIVGQGDLATTNKAALPFGQNGAANSEFLVGSSPPTGWENGGNGNTGQTGAHAMVTGQRRAGYLTFATTPANGTVADVLVTAGSTLALLKRYGLPVVAGDVVGASWLAAQQNATGVQAWINYYDSSGSYLTSDTGSVVTGSGDGSTGNPGNFTKVSVVGTAPANARYATTQVRVHFSGSASPKGWAMSPMLCRLAAGQTVVPEYAPSPSDRAADETGANTAASIIGQGALALLNSLAYGGGYLTGFAALAAKATIDNSALVDAGVIVYTALATTAVRLGVNITRNDGTTSLTDALAVTSLGTAAAIVSQGTFATLSAINSTLADANNLLRRSSGGLFTGELAADVTLTHTAASITSQGGLATLSFITIGTNIRLADGTTIATTALIVTASGTAAAIASQGDLATTNLVQLPFGHNGAVNSDFQRGTYGWYAGWAGNSGLGFSAQGLDIDGAMTRRYYGAQLSGTPGAGTIFDVIATNSLYFSNNSATLGKKFAIPVLPGERVYAAALIMGSGLTSVAVNVDWGDKDFAELTQTQCGSAAPGSGTYDQLQNYVLIGGFATAPANARWAAIYIRATNSGAANPKCLITQPMICRVPASQTAAPPYTPGRSDPIADDTAGNTAAGITGQGALATKNTAARTDIDAGAVSDVTQQNNTGAITLTGSDQVLADVTVTVPDSSTSVHIDWKFMASFLSNAANYTNVFLTLKRYLAGTPTTLVSFTVLSVGVSGVAITPPAAMILPAADSWKDVTPGAGTYTYKIEAFRGTDVDGFVSISQRRLAATMLKR